MISSLLREQIDAARLAAQAQGRRAIELLEESAGLAPQALTAALAEVLACEMIALDAMLACAPAFDRLSYSEALQHDCVALREKNGLGDDHLLLVYADIYNLNLPAWASERLGAPFKMRLAHQSDIAAYLARQEDSMRAVESALGSASGDGNAASQSEELSISTIEGDASPVVKLVHSTLYDALKTDASDIHLQTVPGGLVIKYRLDGVMSQVGAVSEQAMAEQAISRIKVMAELDITEQRVPQDGRFRALYRGREVDFRVSVMPSIHGEDVVIRVLDKQALADHVKGLRLDYLGFDDNVMAVMRRHFLSPYGMVLVTGPTGSGKTTTLYAAISEINHGLDTIITIEDPVEYQLNGVLQIPVNEKKGLTFARGLRSILRHDPDKIMVGEIRDAETAQIAVQSALTGHLVFTTVHANNVFDVIGRLLSMGVDAYSFVSALNIIIAQRLLRTVCKQCAEPVTIAPELAGVAPPPDARPVLGKGCGACRGTGYKGRRAVAEVLCMDDTLREMIAARASTREIKEYAYKMGTRSLRHAALDMAWRGDTTVEEVNRVTAMV
ncbi:MAG: GspE/PulE family protein [Methylophilaceae bacterium]